MSTEDDKMLRDAIGAMLYRVGQKLSETEKARSVFLYAAYLKYRERGLEIAEDLMDELGNGKEFDQELMLQEVERRLQEPPAQIEGVM